ncbi:hypothetical protein LLB_3412 [Legionella longbeachae D-4968]|nr:hypothetical protein LLB_3412 [Legionella longbeachae D-4968]
MILGGELLINSTTVKQAFRPWRPHEQSAGKSPMSYGAGQGTIG